MSDNRTLIKVAPGDVVQMDRSRWTVTVIEQGRPHTVVLVKGASGLRIPLQLFHNHFKTARKRRGKGPVLWIST